MQGPPSLYSPLSSLPGPEQPCKAQSKAPAPAAGLSAGFEVTHYVPGVRSAVLLFWLPRCNSISTSTPVITLLSTSMQQAQAVTGTKVSSGPADRAPAIMNVFFYRDRNTLFTPMSNLGPQFLSSISHTTWLHLPCKCKPQHGAEHSPQPTRGC